MAHKPRPRKSASVDEILNGAVRNKERDSPRSYAVSCVMKAHEFACLTQEPPRRAAGGGPLGRGGNVRGEITDDVILQELAALNKQRANWHVMGLDEELDAAVLSADEYTVIAKLKNEGAGMKVETREAGVVEEDKELQRMREEIEMLDRMAAIMRDKPPSPDRPSSPQRAGPGRGVHGLPVHATASEQRPAGVAVYGDDFHFDSSPPRGHQRTVDGLTSVGGDKPRSPVPAPPVPGGFLGSPGVTEYWKHEKEQMRAEQQAKQRSYREQLDLQKMEARHQRGSAQHGRRSVAGEAAANTSLHFGVEPDDKEEKKRQYRRELDQQVQDKASHSPAKSRASASHLTSPFNAPTPARYGADAGAPSDGGRGSRSPAASSGSALSPGLREASTKVGSMHWGERDVQRWYDEEAKKKEYKEDLLRQMREKQELQQRQGAAVAPNKLLHHHLEAPPSRDSAQPPGARERGAAIRDLAPQFAMPDAGDKERAARPAAQGTHGPRHAHVNAYAGQPPPPPPPPQQQQQQQQHAALMVVDAPNGANGAGHPGYYMSQSPSQYALGGRGAPPSEAGGGLYLGAHEPLPAAWGDDVPSAARGIPGTGRPMWVERGGGTDASNGYRNGYMPHSPSAAHGGVPAAVGVRYDEVPGLGGGASPTGSYVPREQFDAVLAKMQQLEAQVGHMSQNQTPVGREARRARDRGAATASTGTSSYAASSASSRMQAHARVPKAGRRAGR